MIENHDLEGLLRDYFDTEASTITIICPFITNTVLESILPLDDSINVTIVTSWRADHLESRVSDIELFKLAEKRNWTLFINDNLHLKLYVKNLNDCWIGSANLTRKALREMVDGNIEGLYKIDSLQKNDLVLINKILLNSTLVTEEIYAYYKKWILTYILSEKGFKPRNNLPKINIDLTESDYLITKLPAIWSPTKLWELEKGIIPFDDSNEEKAFFHDLALYKVKNSADEKLFFNTLKREFLKHPFIRDFCEQITEDGLRFGGAKEWIQNNCTTIPTPYRRELTYTIQCLFNWIIELSEQYEVIQPNISQIIRLKNSDVNISTQKCEITARDLGRSWYVSDNDFPDNGIQYKSCPSCSKANGKELIFWIGRVYPDTLENRKKSDFGFTPQRRNKKNPDGIQSQCNNCRKQSDTDQKYSAEKGHITIQVLEQKIPNFTIKSKGF